MNRRLFKGISTVFCFFLICVTLVACGNGIGKKNFYKGAKKYLKDKYGVKCDSLIYYDDPQNDNYNTFEFGIAGLDNGDRVIVSLADGNYADSYELYELYGAWTDILSSELGVYVEIADIYSDGLWKEPNLGKFLEQSQKRYNASNVDEFIEDFYDFSDNEKIFIYIIEKEPTTEWMDDLADKLDVYRRKVDAKEIEAVVVPGPLPIWANNNPEDYNYGYVNGMELDIMYDKDVYYHYGSQNYYDNTVCVTWMTEW